MAVMDVSFNQSYPQTHFRTLSVLSIVEFIWKTCYNVGTCVFVETLLQFQPAIRDDNHSLQLVQHYMSTKTLRIHPEQTQPHSQVTVVLLFVVLSAVFLE